MKAPRCAGLVSKGEGNRLATLARHVPPEWAIVELGSHTGLSTCWMAAGSKAGYGAHVTAVDPWQGPRPDSDDDPFGLGDGIYERFAANITAEGHWGRITPLRTLSTVAAQSWVQPVGLLFVDAVHEYDAVKSDYLHWARFLPVGAWLAFHDYSTDPEHHYYGVKQAIDEVIGAEWAEPIVTEHLWTAKRLSIS